MHRSSPAKLTGSAFGSDASGHGSGISDIAWDALRSVPVAGGERQRALCDQDHGPQCRHPADAAAAVDHRRGTRVVVDHRTAHRLTNMLAKGCLLLPEASTMEVCRRSLRSPFTT